MLLVIVLRNTPRYEVRTSVGIDILLDVSLNAPYTQIEIV